VFEGRKSCGGDYRKDGKTLIADAWRNEKKKKKKIKKKKKKKEKHKPAGTGGDLRKPTTDEGGILHGVYEGTRREN